MACEKSAQVHALYDGELNGAARDQIEAHVRDCAACADLLADLKRMSALIASARMTAIPDETSKRVRHAWLAHRAMRERSVLRLAEWMTAAAAAVLIGAMLLWPAGRSDSGSRAGVTTWQAAAITPPASIHDDGAADVIALAQWMADDLSDERGGDR